MIKSIHVAYIQEPQHSDIMLKVWETWTLSARANNIEEATISSIHQQWVNNEVYLTIDINSFDQKEE